MQKTSRELIDELLATLKARKITYTEIAGRSSNSPGWVSQVLRGNAPYEGGCQVTRRIARVIETFYRIRVPDRLWVGGRGVEDVERARHNWPQEPVEVLCPRTRDYGHDNHNGQPCEVCQNQYWVSPEAHDAWKAKARQTRQEAIQAWREEQERCRELRRVAQTE